MAVFKFFGTYSFFIVLSASFLQAQNDPNIARSAMGNGLYNQKGSNSCLYCHGVGGANGSVKSAANLQQPKTWKIYKILGGDSAFAANPDDFRAKMKEATVHLMLKGAIVHNSSFKKDWFDLKKGGGSYNGQMLGMSGGPSASWYKKFKKMLGLKKEVAAESLYLYMQELDQQNIL